MSSSFTHSLHVLPAPTLHPCHLYTSTGQNPIIYTLYAPDALTILICHISHTLNTQKTVQILFPHAKGLLLPPLLDGIDRVEVLNILGVLVIGAATARVGGVRTPPTFGIGTLDPPNFWDFNMGPPMGPPHGDPDGTPPKFLDPPLGPC